MHLFRWQKVRGCRRGRLPVRWRPSGCECLEPRVLLAGDSSVVVVNDVYSGQEDSLLNVTALDGVLANDSDLVDSAPKAFLDVGPLHGGLTLNKDGSFSYEPFADYN